MPDDLQLLESVMTKTCDVIAGAPADAWSRPTPCPDYDVKALIAHMVGWASVFAAAANGERFEGDPGAYSVDDGDPAADFRERAGQLVDGWKSNGTDRMVTLLGGEQPAQTVLNMTLMEYLTHGWDLAVATGQRVPYTDEEAAEVLDRAQQMLPPQYRGEGKAFGEVVTVPDTASTLEKLIGFMGRQPTFSG